ncbi:hypothetical protein AB0D66_18455 [Streptomyces sp. NPDC048270]|uniref:hypothetical protein n=1 Tax=Streptomyces sp. NPDC048270 TaxID=3154615 RepID=UPI0033E4EBA5
MSGDQAIRQLRMLADERALGCEVDPGRLVQAGLDALLAGLEDWDISREELNAGIIQAAHQLLTALPPPPWIAANPPPEAG